MDEREIRGGARWMEELQEIIVKVKAAAIFLGEHGLGRWQKSEIEACVDQNVERDMPVIPVPLPGMPDGFEIPPFLKRFSWVDMRSGLSEEFLERLTHSIPGKRSDLDRKELPPPRPSQGPRIHNLPFLPLGDLFKGRDEELHSLESNLQGPITATAITQTQAIHGLGGIGKTRLAVEYAWRSGDRYDAALFVVAESPEALQSGLASLSRLRLPGLTPSPTHAQEEEVAAVLVWLREHDRWLLILDNVDSEEAAEAVREILPQLQGGQVLITSRRRSWPAGIRRQPLDELSVEEATAFLLQRTEGLRSSTQDDPEHARRLAEVLDGLPLALEQAAAYIAHHQMKLSKYLEVWEKEGVVDWHDEGQMDYPKSLAATWQTAFRQLSPTAAAILRLTAYLAPDPIPLEMFEAGARIVEEGVKLLRMESRRGAKPKPVREGFAELSAYSMITREDETFTVHRMVQEVLRAQIPWERRQEWIEWALRLVNDYLPPELGDDPTRSVWDGLRSHASVVIRYAEEAGILRLIVELMYEQYGELFRFNQLALREALDEFDAMDPEDRRRLRSNLAIHFKNLAMLLQATDRLKEAERLMRQAVDNFEAGLGPGHLLTQRAYRDLEILLTKMNPEDPHQP